MERIGQGFAVVLNYTSFYARVERIEYATFLEFKCERGDAIKKKKKFDEGLGHGQQERAEQRR